MRHLICFILMVLMAISVTASARVYDGPSTIDTDIVWEDEVLTLNGTVMVTPNGSLTLRNVTLGAASGFEAGGGWPHPLLEGHGPIVVIDSTLEGGTTFTPIYADGNVSITGSTLSNGVYTVFSTGNLTVRDTAVESPSYGIQVNGGDLSMRDCVVRDGLNGLIAHGATVVLDNVTFEGLSQYAARLYDTTAHVTGVCVENAGEGLTFIDSSGTVVMTAVNVSRENCVSGCGGDTVSGAPLGLYESNVTVLDSDFSSSDMGIGAYSAVIDVTRSTFSDLPHGLLGYEMSGTVRNSTFDRCDVAVEGGTIDVSMADNTMNGTPVEVREWWQVSFDVRDPYGDPVRGAVITLVDAVGNESSGRTDALGGADLPLIGREIVNGTPVPRSPFDIVVSAEGSNLTLDSYTLVDGDTLDVTLPLWRPDIEILEVRYKQDPGEKVHLTAVVRNSGDATALDVTVDFTYSVGGDTRVIGTVDLGDIGPNTSVEASLDWDADEGDYVVAAHAVTGGWEHDRTANNNVASTHVTVEGPGPDPMVLVMIVVFAVMLFALLTYLIRKVRVAPEEAGGLPPMTWADVAGRRRAPGPRRPEGSADRHRGGRSPGRHPPAGRRPPVGRQPPRA